MISLLTINVRGVSNKHCLLPFFQFSQNWHFNRFSTFIIYVFVRRAIVKKQSNQKLSYRKSSPSSCTNCHLQRSARASVLIAPETLC